MAQVRVGHPQIKPGVRRRRRGELRVHLDRLCRARVDPLTTSPRDTSPRSKRDWEVRCTAQCRPAVSSRILQDDARRSRSGRTRPRMETARTRMEHSSGRNQLHLYRHSPVAERGLPHFRARKATLRPVDGLGTFECSPHFLRSTDIVVRSDTFGSCDDRGRTSADDATGSLPVSVVRGSKTIVVRSNGSAASRATDGESGAARECEGNVIVFPTTRGKKYFLASSTEQRLWSAVTCHCFPYGPGETAGDRLTCGRLQLPKRKRRQVAALQKGRSTGRRRHHSQSGLLRRGVGT